jgi:DNA polymerase III sliding clamp (beta) subunit (PCNA family)
MQVEITVSLLGLREALSRVRRAAAPKAVEPIYRCVLVQMSAGAGLTLGATDNAIYLRQTLGPEEGTVPPAADASAVLDAARIQKMIDALHAAKHERVVLSVEGNKFRLQAGATKYVLPTSGEERDFPAPPTLERSPWSYRIPTEALAAVGRKLLVIAKPGGDWESAFLTLRGAEAECVATDSVRMFVTRTEILDGPGKGTACAAVPAAPLKLLVAALKGVKDDYLEWMLGEVHDDKHGNDKVTVAGVMRLHAPQEGLTAFVRLADTTHWVDYWRIIPTSGAYTAALRAEDVLAGIEAVEPVAMNNKHKTVWHFGEDGAGMRLVANAFEEGRAEYALPGELTYEDGRVCGEIPTEAGEGDEAPVEEMPPWPKEALAFNAVYMREGLELIGEKSILVRFDDCMRPMLIAGAGVLSRAAGDLHRAEAFYVLMPVNNS